MQKDEVVHVLEGTELYDVLATAVKNYSTTKGEWNSRLKSTAELYNGISEDAEGELVADLVGDYLFTDSSFLERLSVEHRNIFQKLWGEVKYLCRIATAGSKEARHLEKVKKAFEDAYRNTKPAEKNTDTESDGVRYAIGYTENNDPVVIVEGNILDGVPKKDWVKTVKQTISGNFSAGIPINGRLIKVNQRTGREFTNSKYSKYLKSSDGVVYEDKFKSANNLDEIVLASTNYINEDLKHKRKDNFIEFARGNVLIRVGNNDYSAKVIVGFTSGKQMVLYDIVNFTTANFNIKKESTPDNQKSKVVRNGALSKNIIPNSPQNVKQRQLEIINQYNPAPNSYNTWVRTVDDIKTFEEALNDGEYTDCDEFSPDYTREMAEKAIKEGEITVYSSYPIEQGVFVTPSRMEAESYSGNGRVYSKKVPLSSVAWIDITQGQYAEVQYSLISENQSREAVGDYNVYGRDVKLASDEVVPVQERQNNVATEEYGSSFEDFEKQRREEFEALDDADEVGAKQGDVFVEDNTVEVINDQDLQYITNILKDTLYLSPRQVGEIKKIVRDYSSAEHPSKTRLKAEIQSKFGTIKFTEKVEEIEAIKKELRSRDIKVSDAIKNDIADYGDFYRSQYRKLSLKESGTPVDSLYMELTNNYPDFFPEDIINPSDQLQRIAEVVDMDTYNRGEYEVDEETIQKAVDVIAEGVGRYRRVKKTSKATATTEERVFQRRQEIETYIESDSRERKNQKDDNLHIFLI